MDNTLIICIAGIVALLLVFAGFMNWRFPGDPDRKWIDWL